ncbi:hypothetical protein C7M84_015942 [Penaeus vannamei]|uniref:Sushi domain-containing protein n=1 Tax=Penaeus vannamei TaxID=6689 RepID=A0A423SPC2_PENVA|nr:hypothetical protein C7M84_015942 [Penaeus vannamei]
MSTNPSGPTGCWDAPPPPTINMTHVWDNTTARGSVITYVCLDGYFVNGNVSLTEQNITCLGQLGGWFPALLDCYYVEVCLEDPPAAPSPLIANFTSEDLRYVGGFLNFTCPEGMATVDGNTSQEVVCRATAEVATYAFVPAVVKPCNGKGGPRELRAWGELGSWPGGPGAWSGCVDCGLL